MTLQTVSVILLAGGIGSRMKSATPKQFLPLHSKPIARYSFDLLLTIPEVSEMVVVCAPEYRHHFENVISSKPIRMSVISSRCAKAPV